MKKKLVLISSVSFLCALGILSYQSWMLGFFITKSMSGYKEGKRGLIPSVVIYFRSHRLHLHHWIICLIGTGITALKGIYVFSPDVFYGFLTAVIFQGIYCYEDWHRIYSRHQTLAPIAAD